MNRHPLSPRSPQIVASSSYRRRPQSTRSSGGGGGAPSGQPPRRGLPPQLLTIGIPVLVAVLALVGLSLWVWAARRPDDLSARTGGDVAAPVGQTAGAAPAAANPVAAGPAAGAAAVASGGGAAGTNLPGAWPGFRGANRDNVSTEKTPLARTWGPNGPPVLWSLDGLGEGYASAAVLNGKVYLLDYDEANRADSLRCLSLANGQELWHQSYPADVKSNHGKSRTVPAVTDKYVVTIGPLGYVMCCDAGTGKILWRINLPQQWGAPVPEWYNGQCPLIVDGKVILATGGKALMIAVDCGSGQVAWQTPNALGWKMTHSSVQPVDFGGGREYVCCYDQGVAGVSAAGKLLWSTTEWKVSTATIPVPVVVGDGKLFFSGGYNSGGLMAQLQGSGDQVSFQTLFRVPPNVFQTPQHTPIFYKGYLYGVRQGGELVCLDLNGKQVWTSGAQARYGLGPFMIAEDMIYALGEDGTLTLVEASPSGFKLLARAKILNGTEAWGPLALAGGRLLARDLHQMVCLNVAQ